MSLLLARDERHLPVVGARLRELKEQFPDRKCTVFNTNSISLGAGIQAEQAALLKQKGASDEEILDFLKEYTDHVAVYFVVDDLMHLKRGGRCSGIAAVAGTLLGLKTHAHLQRDGRASSVIGKLNGRKKAISTLANKIVEETHRREHPRLHRGRGLQGGRRQAARSRPRKAAER